MGDAFLDDVDHPTDFNDPRLQKLDFDLRCSICQEFYTTPMQLATCVHCFCAICIRRRLAIERTCPTCAKPADESKLVRNSALENAVNSWKATRKLIIDLEQKSKTVSTSLPTVATTASIPQIPAAVSQMSTTNPYCPPQPPPPPPPPASTPGTRRSTRIENRKSSTASSPDNIVQVNPNQVTAVSVSQSRPTSIATSSQAQTPSRDIPLQPGPNDIVECFNCLKNVKMSNINAHLDKCLQEPQPSPSPSNTSRQSHPLLRTSQTKSPQYNEKYLGKKPIKLVYGMMNVKDLKKVLRDLGLSDVGNDKNLLIWRHREWLTLYEANMDAEHPVDFHTLKRRLDEAEEAHLNSRDNGYRQSPDLEQHKARYDDHFQQLKAQVQKRKASSEHITQPHPSVRRSNPSPNVHSTISEHPPDSNRQC